MKYLITALVLIFVFGLYTLSSEQKNTEPTELLAQQDYWLLLHRISNKEFLYQGIPGNTEKSQLIKTFQVKTGQPGKRPTPLPQLLGRDYWLIIKKFETPDNPEIAPYFLTLDIPYSTVYPFGPTPYLECNGQCNWELPGSFGLHGINGDTTRLLTDNPGSSGCIRHTDEDITYLYNLFSPEENPIRYYIEDI